jgi:hypothetical protein
MLDPEAEMNFVILLTCVVAFMALWRGQLLKDRIQVLEAKIERLSAQRKAAQGQASVPDISLPLISDQAENLAPAAVPTPEPRPVVEQAAVELPCQNAPDPAGQKQYAGHSLESIIGNRWGLWLGGFVLLLSAGFFVREAVLNGWVGPVARTLSLFFIAGGFIWAGRSSVIDQITNKLEVGWSQVRPVLNAVGVSFLCAGAYAAGPHYGLIGAAAFSAGMIVISAFALYSSISYGVPVAVIGILGGFFLPFIADYSTSALGTTGTLLYLAILFVTADLSFRPAKRVWLQAMAAAATVVDGGAMIFSDPHSAILFLFLIIYLIAASILDPARVEGKDNHPDFKSYLSIAIILSPLLAGAIISPNSLMWLSCFGVLTPIALALARLKGNIWHLAPLLGLADLAFLGTWNAGETQYANLYVTATALVVGFTLPLIKLGATKKTDPWLILQAVMTLGVTFIVYARTAPFPLPPGHELSSWTLVFSLLGIMYFGASLNEAGKFFTDRTNTGQLVQKIVAFIFGLAAISYLAMPHEVSNTMLAFIVIVLGTTGEDSGFYRYLRPVFYVLAAICGVADLSFLDADPSALPYSTVLIHAFMPALLLRLLSTTLRGKKSTVINTTLEDADLFSSAAGGVVLIALLWSVNWAYYHGIFGADYIYWMPIAFMLETLGAALLLWVMYLLLPQPEVLYHYCRGHDARFAPGESFCA